MPKIPRGGNRQAALDAFNAAAKNMQSDAPGLQHLRAYHNKKRHLL
jgi:hypothetical protein